MSAFARAEVPRLGARAEPVMEKESVEPRPRNRPLQLAAGGVIGGVAGFYAGAVLGHAVDPGPRHDCIEFCGSTLLGGLTGEALGMAAGVHLANGRQGNLLLNTLTSSAILVGGLYAGSEKNGLLLVTPLVQLAGTVLVEHARDR